MLSYFRSALETEKMTSPPASSPSVEQPLDLSAKSTGSSSSNADGRSSTGGPPPPSGTPGSVQDPGSPSALEARLSGLRVPPIDPKQVFK